MTFPEKVECVMKAVMGVFFLGLYGYCVVTQTPVPETFDQILLIILGGYYLVTAVTRNNHYNNLAKKE